MTCFVALFVSGCAYQFGNGRRSLPKGHQSLSIPMFGNDTFEVGIERYFTQALRMEFERSKLVVVTEKSDADVFVSGNIESVRVLPAGARFRDGVALATEYRLSTVVRIDLVQTSDEKVIWTGKFRGENTFFGPQILTPVLNSANPLYNLSARRQTLRQAANQMMNEAFDRITENF